MILPENGSVVIIDDRPEEALPILHVLSKKGIATTYYKGSDPTFLPENPTQTIRLLFLDLQLIETADDHQISRNVTNILNRLISSTNGPYILVVWSKNRGRYEKVVVDEIKKYPHLIPACIIGFSKRDCLEEKVIQLIEPDKLTKDVLDKINGRLEKEDEDFVIQAVNDLIKNEYRTEFIAKDNALAIIEGKIKEGLESAGVFHLFVIWENLVRKAGANTVQAITCTIEPANLWELNMKDVIKRMARARTGQNTITNTEILKSSLTTFSYSFSEGLESEIRDYVFPQYISTDSTFIIANDTNGVKLEIQQFNDGGPKVKLLKDGEIIKGKEKVGFTSMSKLSEGIKEPDKTIVDSMVSTYSKIPYQINTKLHLELNPNDELIPGNIYIIEMTNEKKDKYLLTYFEKIKGDLNNYIFIELEVSPICDYAQTKWKKSRLISGIIYSEENTPKKLDHLYKVQPQVLIDEKPFKMVFDFHLFKSLDNEIVKKRKIRFRLKRELLLDIIANLSGHVNRPGVSFME